MNNEKMLLIFPPQWTPISPHIAIPLLAGQLKSNGYNVSAIDLNIDFYETILTKEYLEHSLEKAKKQYEKLKSIVPSLKNEEITLEKEITLSKYNSLNYYLTEHEKTLSKIPNLIELSKNIFRSNYFYNYDILLKAILTVNNALNIVSLPYLPSKIHFNISSENPLLRYTYENIKYFVFDEQTNIYIEYFKNRIDNILKDDPKYIGISIGFTSQLIPGLTLAHLLKKHTDAHISIGGNYINRIANEIMKHREFFKIFADSLSVGEGEGPILEMAKFINGQTEIEKVPNLIYIKDNKIVQNPAIKPLRLDETSNINLDDYNLKKYYSPEIVLPFLTSRGCYWNKCSFCSHEYEQSYNQRNMDKTIREIKELKEKYNINKFELVDATVSPSLMLHFSEQLLKQNIDIKYFCCARVESTFNYKIFEQAYKSGLRMILWGIESASNKIIKLMNKGICADKMTDILKCSEKANIWNHAFIIFGFPGETFDDAKETLNMLLDNKKSIDSFGGTSFILEKLSEIMKKPFEYGITKIYEDKEEFSTEIKNYEKIGMTEEELEQILNISSKESQNRFQTYSREWDFLYLCKYDKRFLIENYSYKKLNFQEN